MDLKTISSAVEQIAADRGIKPEHVIEAIEGALASAYKKEYRNRSEIIRAKFDSKTGNVKFWQVKIVVDPEKVRVIEDEEESAAPSSPPATDGQGKTSTDKSTTAKSGSTITDKELEKRGVEKKDKATLVESGQAVIEDEEQLLRYNPDRHIFLEEAKKIKSDAEVDDEITFPLETHDDFGRIAAQTAKQVILQNIREAERISVHEEFADKEGEIVSGVIQRVERQHVYVDLGRAVGVMFQNECIPGEHYRVGQRFRFFVIAVQAEERGKPGIVLSRAHPDFVAKLFEIEVPEILEGVVEIKRIAREPGSRTKIAVISNQEEIDPVGSAVGQRGTRIMAVTNELGNEKIDVVEWSEDPEEYIASSLSPAKVKLVEIKPRREALVLVEENQLSLAIGRGGQNVRLSAKITGWKIDVRSQSRPEEEQEGGVAETAEEKENEPAEEQTADIKAKSKKPTDDGKKDGKKTANDKANDNDDKITDDDSKKESGSKEKKPRKRAAAKKTAAKTAKKATIKKKPVKKDS